MLDGCDALSLIVSLGLSRNEFPVARDRAAFQAIASMRRCVKTSFARLCNPLLKQRNAMLEVNDTQIELLRARAERAPLISIKQAAKRYSVSVRTLRRLQAAGKMPERVKQSRRLMYPKAELDLLFKAADTVNL